MSKLKGFIGETVVYGFANVFSRVFAMLLIPLYKDLGKDVYANLVMLQSAFSVLTFILALNSGVFYYYYEYKKSKYRKIVFTSWFYYQLAMASFLVLLLISFRHELANLFVGSGNNAEVLVTAILLIGIQFFPYIVNITNINLYRINRKPKHVMYITLTEAFLILVMVWGGITYFSFGMIEIIGSQLAARSIVALLFVGKMKFYINIRSFSMKMLNRLVSFSWPFFVISAFSWAIISLDKFIGVRLLSDQEHIAMLALAMQLSLPIAILADMIRMSIGPFIMSIRKDSDADRHYQQIFDLSLFSGFVVFILLMVFSPLLILFLADETFLPVLRVLPLIAIASIISLIANQFAISFSLTKRNVFILYATVIGGLLGFLSNLLFMRDFGFIISGISQVLSYLAIATFLYVLGKKKTDLKLKLGMGLNMLVVNIIFLSFIYWDMSTILEGNFATLILSSCLTGSLIIGIYMRTQNLTFSKIFANFRRKP